MSPRAKKGGSDFAPHPGDPWHPSWTPQSEGDGPLEEFLPPLGETPTESGSVQSLYDSLSREVNGGPSPVITDDRRAEIEREIRSAIEAERAEVELTEAHEMERSRLEEARRAAEAVARRAAEEQARVAAERAAAEHEARRATERAAQLEARHAAERLAAEHSAREAAEEEVRRITQRLAAEESARRSAEEHMRDAVQSAARQAAELAVEQAVKDTKARLAAEVAARAAAEEQARIAADRLVEAESAAQLEAQRAADRLAEAESAAQLESQRAADRLSVEESARHEAEAAIELARLKAEEAADAAQRTAAQATEMAAAEEASRRAAEEEARLTALKLTAEEQARIAAEEAVAASRAERELATVEAAKQAEEKEAARLEAEKRVTLITTQLAAEQAARRRAEQDASEATAEVDQQRRFVEAIREEELRLAEAREQERQARLSAEEQAAQARRDAARAAQLANEADKARRAAEQHARLVEERLAAVEAAMVDAEKATVEARRRADVETNRRAAEEVARISAEDKARVASAERRAAEAMIHAAAVDAERSHSARDAELAAVAAESAARRAAEEQKRLTNERHLAEEAARHAAAVASQAAQRVEAEDQARRVAEAARREAESEARRARLASEEQQARLKAAETAALAALHDAPTLAQRREAEKIRAERRLAIEAAAPPAPVLPKPAPRVEMKPVVIDVVPEPVAASIARPTVVDLAPYRVATVRADALPAPVAPLQLVARTAGVHELDWWWEPADDEVDTAAAWFDAAPLSLMAIEEPRKWWQFWRRSASQSVAAPTVVGLDPVHIDFDHVVALIADDVEELSAAVRRPVPVSAERTEAMLAAVSGGYLAARRLARVMPSFNSESRSAAYRRLWGPEDGQGVADVPARVFVSQERIEAFTQALADGYLAAPAADEHVFPSFASEDRTAAFEAAAAAGTWPLRYAVPDFIDLTVLERDTTTTGIDIMALLDPEIRESVTWMDDDEDPVSVTSTFSDNDPPSGDGGFGSGPGGAGALERSDRELVSAGVAASAAGMARAQSSVDPAISAWMSNTAAIDKVAVGTAATSGSWLQRLFSKRFQGLGLTVDIGAGLGESDLVRVVRLASAVPSDAERQPIVAPIQPDAPREVEVHESGIQAPLPVDFGGDDGSWVPDHDDAAYEWLDDDEPLPEWDNGREPMSENSSEDEYGNGHDPDVPQDNEDAIEASPVAPAAPQADLVDDETALTEPVDEVDELFQPMADWDGPEPDFSGFTAERYVSSSTAEHVGLADAMALAASEAPGELMALSADIPGLERGLVGLEDMQDLDSTNETVVRTASDLPARMLTGLGLISLVILGIWSGRIGLGVLIVAAMGIAAAEFYTSVRRSGLEPMIPVGLVGCAIAFGGTVVWGLVAIPVAILLTAVAALVALTLLPERSRPLVNVSLTVLGVAWVGGLGAFAMDMLRASEFRWLILATVLVTALLDMGSYFIGRAFGTHPIAPQISPKKTVEGLVGGVVVAILAGGVVGFLGPFDLASGLLLGVSIAVIAPLGDLAVSIIKRSVGIKDMSSILPGHGGLFDRLDAILFAVPTAWVVFHVTGLLG